MSHSSLVSKRRQSESLLLCTSTSDHDGNYTASGSFLHLYNLCQKSFSSPPPIFFLIFTGNTGHLMSHVTQPQRWMKQICRMRLISPAGNISSTDTLLSLGDVEFAERATACTESLVQEAENELEVHFQHGMMNLATESEIDSANFVMI